MGKHIDAKYSSGGKYVTRTLVRRVVRHEAQER
jgi:hypothetical protein